MKAYNHFSGFAEPMERFAANDRRSPFAAAQGDPTRELHNARGLVIAVLMSAACWAGVGLAFLL